MSDPKLEYKYSDFTNYKDLAIRMEHILAFKCAQYYGVPVGKGMGEKKRMGGEQYNSLKMFAYYEILRRLKTDASRNKFINNKKVIESLEWGGAQL